MSTKNTNQLNVPEARAAMDKFKMEAASEVGVNLKEGYNGDLTSREAGSVDGQEDDRVLREESVSHLLFCAFLRDSLIPSEQKRRPFLLRRGLLYTLCSFHGNSYC